MMNKEELFSIAIRTYGAEAQVNQGIEEMAASLWYWRTR